MLAHGMGFKFGHLFVGHSLSLCSNPLPTFLVDRINFGLKVLWMGCNLFHFAEQVEGGSCMTTGSRLFRFHVFTDSWVTPLSEVSFVLHMSPTSLSLSVADFHSFS